MGRRQTSRQEKQGAERPPGTSRLAGPRKVKRSKGRARVVTPEEGVEGKGSAMAEHTGAKALGVKRSSWNLNLVVGSHGL